MWSRFRKSANANNDLDAVVSDDATDVAEDVIIEGFDKISPVDDQDSDHSDKGVEITPSPDSMREYPTENENSQSTTQDLQIVTPESLNSLSSPHESKESTETTSPQIVTSISSDEILSLDINVNSEPEKIVIYRESFHQATDHKDLRSQTAEHEAEAAPLQPPEHQDDLNEVTGHELPTLKVPEWRDELDFVKKRIEPCDMTSHIVKVTRRRLLAKRIELILAEVKLKVYTRYLERASRRFADRINEDRALREAMADIAGWRDAQSKSVAWILAERVENEVQKAKAAEDEAKQYVMRNTEFQNSDAVAQYRNFVKRLFFIPVFNLYIISVVSLTFNRFEWILKHFPFFNLGLNNSIIMICGISSVFWLANLWRYAKSVSRTQRDVAAFNSEYEKQKNRITHAVREHTRLSQQQPLLEPILQVLAVGYRTQLQSSFDVKVNATTKFDTDTLPACVTLAMAVDTDQRNLAALRNKATRMLTGPGWRTDGLNNLAKRHSETMSTKITDVGLSLLDVDSDVSMNNARRLLLEAFDNLEMQNSVNTIRLRDVVEDLHRSVLAKWDSEARPRVVSLRNDGFNKLSFKTSWLASEDASEDWLEFLTEILNKPTPFGQFNIANKSSGLNLPERITSIAVVPHYFQEEFTKITKVEKSKVTDVMPIDVVVRVDVSEWADPKDFAVFADQQFKEADTSSAADDGDSDSIDGQTDA